MNDSSFGVHFLAISGKRETIFDCRYKLDAKTGFKHIFSSIKRCPTDIQSLTAYRQGFEDRNLSE